jgi:hypothetical protein
VKSPETAIWKENDVDGYDKYGFIEIPPLHAGHE